MTSSTVTRTLMLMLALALAGATGSAAPSAAMELDTYHALRYAMRQFEVTNVVAGQARDIPVLYVSGGKDFAGGDSHRVNVYGPGAGSWESGRQGKEGILRQCKRTEAPWGGVLHIWYVPFQDDSKSNSPFADRGTPASIHWYWAYRDYAINVSRYWDGDVSEADANREIRKLAEAVHRGFVEDGLADGADALAVASRFRAVISVAPLKPGEVLSPSVSFVDQDGKPPDVIKGIAWLIDGKFAQSVVWDGKRTVIEVQATVDEQAIVQQVVIPAYGEPWPAELQSAAAPPTEGPLPGLGGIGALPGPASAGQALVGLLAPPLIGMLGAWLSGLFAGGRAPPGPAGQRPPPARKPPKATKPKPPPAKVANDEQMARRALERVAAAARSVHNPALRDAVDKAGKSIYGKDGKFDGQAWKEAQKELRSLLGQMNKDVPAPDSWLRDAAAATAHASGELARGLVQGAGALAQGIGHLAVNAYSGGKSILDALLHPGDFERGMREALKTWTDNHAAAERQAFNEALRDGRIGDALRNLGSGVIKAQLQVAEKAWAFVQKELLPWDELKSFWDPHASLQERLWAVPAAAVKVAGLLLIFEPVSTKPSTRWGTALHDAIDRHAAGDLARTAEQAAARASQLKAQVASMERVAAGQSGKSGIQSLLEQSRKALTRAQELAQSAKAAHEVELLTMKAMRGREPFQNFQQAQKALEENPELTRAIDAAIVRNNGGKSLYELRAGGQISADAHTLMTARKLKLQDQAVNNAARRIIEKEAQALLAANQPVPRRFHTFNATQGSRSRLSGSNINADLEQTLIGLKHVSREESEQIIREECRKLGMTQEQLDINIYRPGKGLMDAKGAAPNAQVTLENIGQTTGTAGHHQVHVAQDGTITVGDHVATAQGREGVMAGRRTMQPPPGMTQEQWLNEGIWEGHQGAPIPIPKELWPGIRETQMHGLEHAFETGDMNQMVKYANRGNQVGMPLDEATTRLVRAVAGQKDPALASRMLADAGIHSPAELMARLGGRH